MTLEDFVAYAQRKAEELAEKNRIESERLEREQRDQNFISSHGNRDGIYPYQGHYVVVKDGAIVSHEDTKADAWREYCA